MRHGAKIYMVHVIYDITKATGWYVPHTSAEEVYADLEKSARKELEKTFLTRCGNSRI